jgi:hypothetical protein
VSRSAFGACICEPCVTPAYGVPGRDHCAACCYGSLIEAYNHDCPRPDHREMAVRQFGPVAIGDPHEASGWTENPWSERPETDVGELVERELTE